MKKLLLMCSVAFYTSSILAMDENKKNEDKSIIRSVGSAVTKGAATIFGGLAILEFSKVGYSTYRYVENEVIYPEWAKGKRKIKKIVDEANDIAGGESSYFYGTTEKNIVWFFIFYGARKACLELNKYFCSDKK